VEKYTTQWRVKRRRDLDPITLSVLWIIKLLSAIWTRACRTARVTKMPGARLNNLAEEWFSKKCYEQILRPMLAEMQHEYLEALSQGRTRKAKLIRLRGVCCFWSHVMGLLVVTPAKAIKRLWTLAGT
jgi:hypothetical protein